MSTTEDVPRRSFLAGASATLAMSMAPGALRGGPAHPGEQSLLELSATEAVARMSRGDITAEHYAHALLDRCTAGQGLNAFISFEPERVLEEARQRDRERRAGARPGALFGLPVPIKDLSLIHI